MLPAIGLFPQVVHEGRKIDARVFGPGTYNKNLDSMQNHSDDLPNVTFKPLTTAESLAVASYDFKNLAKPEIFNPRWLQAGLALKVSEGAWINPLKDAEGNIIIDNQELEKHLGKTNKVNGIYLLGGDTSFVPYDSFEQGVQEHEKFLEGGLARGLVHTSDKKATILSSIANDTEYPLRVNVVGFDSFKEPLVMVVSLGSGRGVGGLRLDVYGLFGYLDYGFAFGGLVSGEASAQKTK